MTKRLPVGIQSFENLRTGDYVYVDKTEYVYRMITGGHICFLSRPQHFGKSLLVSTLEALFCGRKELFEGLWIYDRWDWTRKYPVIRIDCNGIPHASPDEMKKEYTHYMRNIAAQFNQQFKIVINSDSPSKCFRELIEQLHRKSGEKAVILIDEYDKPVISHLSAPHLNEIKTALLEFYQVMKYADEHIHFVFCTGESEVSKFSPLSNFDDITPDKEFAAICGYTEEELTGNFMEYIDAAADSCGWSQEQTIEYIRFFDFNFSWNGKIFSPDSNPFLRDGKTYIYNPVSTLRFLKRPQIYRKKNIKIKKFFYRFFAKNSTFFCK
jgi:hypothetical protein